MAEIDYSDVTGTAPVSPIPALDSDIMDIYGWVKGRREKKEAEDAAEKARIAAEEKFKKDQEDFRKAQSEGAAERAAARAAREAQNAAASKGRAGNGPVIFNRHGTPENVSRAMRGSGDGQKFSEQSEWTQRAFKARYGEVNAAAAWAREHAVEIGAAPADTLRHNEELTRGSGTPDSGKPEVPKYKPGTIFTPQPVAQFPVAQGVPSASANGAPSAMATPAGNVRPVTPPAKPPSPDDILTAQHPTGGAVQPVRRADWPIYEKNGWVVTHDPAQASTGGGDPSRLNPNETSPGASANAHKNLSLSEDGTAPTYQLARLTARTGTDPQQEGTRILQGIGKLIRGERGGAEFEPYLNDMARLAWAKESGGGDPRQAPLEYIESWKDAFFGSDHNVTGVKELDQQLIDNAVSRTGSGNGRGVFDWRLAFGPTGESGLISRQIASNDCGPNSFASILRSQGYNVDSAQAFAYAKEKGYHNGEQFTGPYNMARMISQETGMQAEARALDWGGLESEIANGRPVLLSSGTHYWTVAAVRDGPRGKEYYTGATGAVAGHGAWATADEIKFAYGGDPGVPSVMITSSGTVDPNSRAVREMGLQPPGTQGATRAMLSQGNVAPGSTTQSSNTDQYATVRMRSNNLEGSYYERYQTNSGDDRLAKYAAGAEAENPWISDPTAQPNRHAGMRYFYELPEIQREAIFDESMEEALRAEGIPPDQWVHWKTNMAKVVVGTPQFHGENPNLNPFMMAGEGNGTPMYASDSSDRSPNANELNSSAQGYYQFIVHGPDGTDQYGHKRHIPPGANFYDPVTQHRMFIRAISAPGSKHRGDPASVVREKTETGVWGP